MSNSAPRWLIKFRNGSGDSDYVDVSDQVLSLKYVDSEHAVDKATIVIDNYLADVYDSKLVSHGNWVQVSFGYVDGDMSPVYETVVTKVSGGDQVTVEARAKSVLMDTKKIRKAYRNKTRSEVVRIIAAKYGYTGPSLVVEDTEEVFGQITQHNLTDAMFIRKLAEKQGFSFWVSFDGLHWHSRDLQQAPLTELVYFTSPGQGSIYNYNVENDITRMPGRVRTAARDPLTKKTITGKADNEEDSDRTILQPEKALTEFRLDIDEETLSVSTGDFPLGGIPQDDAVASAEQTPGSVQTEATKRFRRTSLSAVKMSLNCKGDPLVMAKRVLKISGLGSRVSGKYYVKEVTHELSSGYDMSLKVATDGYMKSQPKKCAVDTSAYDYLDEAEAASQGVADPELRESIRRSTAGVRSAMQANKPEMIRSAINKTFPVIYALRKYREEGFGADPAASSAARAAERALTQTHAILTPCLDPDNAAQGRQNDKDVVDPDALEQRLYIDEETLEVRTNFTSAYDGRGYFDGEITQTKKL